MAHAADGARDPFPRNVDPVDPVAMTDDAEAVRLDAMGRPMAPRLATTPGQTTVAVMAAAEQRTQERLQAQVSSLSTQVGRLETTTAHMETAITEQSSRQTNLVILAAVPWITACLVGMIWYLRRAQRLAKDDRTASDETRTFYDVVPGTRRVSRKPSSSSATLIDDDDLPADPVISAPTTSHKKPTVIFSNPQWGEQQAKRS